MPSLVEYDKAIMHPDRFCSDSQLKTGHVIVVERQANNNVMIRSPFKSSGSYAVAYKFSLQNNKTKAVRCFFNVDTQRGQRYHTLELFFNQQQQRSTIGKYIVGYRYIPQGIRVVDHATIDYYPVLMMDWVEGKELRTYINDLVNNRDIVKLKQLSDKWLELINAMRQVQMAHGDLSGNNIMVKQDGSLILVDYDGMYIPAFSGQRPIEAGADEYQHPKHVEHRKFDQEMDRFSALLIYVVFKVLEEQPELWKKYSLFEGQRLTSDWMLFKTEDLSAPNTSAVFREILGNIADPLTLQLINTLKQACIDPIEKTPLLLDIADPHRQQKEDLQKLVDAIAKKDDEQIVISWKKISTYSPAKQYEPNVRQAEANLKNIKDFKALPMATTDDAANIRTLWLKVQHHPQVQQFRYKYEWAEKVQKLWECMGNTPQDPVLFIETYNSISPKVDNLQGQAGIFRPISLEFKTLEGLKDDEYKEIIKLYERIRIYKGSDRFEQKYKKALDHRIVHDQYFAKLQDFIRDKDDKNIVATVNAMKTNGVSLDATIKEAFKNAQKRIDNESDLRKSLQQNDSSNIFYYWFTYGYEGSKLVQDIEKNIWELLRDKYCIKNIKKSFINNTLNLTWDWPDPIQTVCATVSQVGHETEINAQTPRITKNEYHRIGSYILGVQPARTHYIMLISLVLHPNGKDLIPFFSGNTCLTV